MINLSRRFLSNSLRSFLFLFTSAKRKFNESSKAFYSLEITLPRSYYSRPPYVTVKSIIVVLADNSGLKAGLDKRQVINNLKFALNSI